MVMIWWFDYNIHCISLIMNFEAEMHKAKITKLSSQVLSIVILSEIILEKVARLL